MEHHETAIGQQSTHLKNYKKNVKFKKSTLLTQRSWISPKDP